MELAYSRKQAPQGCPHAESHEKCPATLRRADPSGRLVVIYSQSCEWILNLHDVIGEFLQNCPHEGQDGFVWPLEDGRGSFCSLPSSVGRSFGRSLIQPTEAELHSLKPHHKALKECGSGNRTSTAAAAASSSSSSLLLSLSTSSSQRSPGKMTAAAAGKLTT